MDKFSTWRKRRAHREKERLLTLDFLDPHLPGDEENHDVVEQAGKFLQQLQEKRRGTSDNKLQPLALISDPLALSIVGLLVWIQHVQQSFYNLCQ